MKDLGVEEGRVERLSGVPGFVGCRRKRLSDVLECSGSRRMASADERCFADTLDITPSTAVHWIKTAGGEWTGYAAQRAKARASLATEPPLSALQETRS